MRLEITEGYKPTQNVLFELISKQVTYEEAVSLLSQQKLNAPCFVILGSEEEGTILARSYETLDF